MGEKGIKFFKDTLKKHGADAPYYIRQQDRNIRNYLRTLDECKSWGPINLDNRWMEIVKEAIK